MKERRGENIDVCLEILEKHERKRKTLKTRQSPHLNPEHEFE